MNTGGYYHSLPLDPLRKFIDTAAEVQRAMGFQNEKDHPEVAPAQFEINYSYGEVVAAADQIQLYKLLARQVANNMGFTASFLPKPVVGVNGSGMHTNMSIMQNKVNLMWDANGQEMLSAAGPVVLPWRPMPWPAMTPPPKPTARQAVAIRVAGAVNQAGNRRGDFPRGAPDLSPSLGVAIVYSGGSDNDGTLSLGGRQSVLSGMVTDLICT